MGCCYRCGLPPHQPRAANSKPRRSACIQLDVPKYLPPLPQTTGEPMPSNTQAAGCIHLFFEGYFAVNYKTLAGGQTLFAQLWKEYSLSDSRYLTSDAFLVYMESVTAVSDISDHLFASFR